ncbi:tRNA (32-2'-O)-methyltransferase regulator THADA-like [Diadema antillarum]|uniref:tRNA (32-2'-O)-methyltransferase regulator THADA-like n=1 Tax=Diadema antillarum TaxID=105358 RepID=UPI003A8B80F4
MEELLMSISEFSEKIARSDGNLKQWLATAEAISRQVHGVTIGVQSNVARERSSASYAHRTPSLLDEVVARFCWLFFESAVDIKLVRILHKAAVALQTISRKMEDIIDCQFLVLLSENAGCMTFPQASKVCNLIEGSPMVHKPLEAHFPQVIGALHRTMTWVVADVTSSAPGTAISPGASSHSLVLAKLMLQACQLVPQHHWEAIWNRSAPHQTRELCSHLSGLVGNLVTIMCCKKFSRESGLMSGCAVGMLFNTSTSPRDAVAMATSLLSSFHQGDSAREDPYLKDGIFNGLTSLMFQNFSPSERAFGKLCLTRGLITCADPKIILERIPDNIFPDIESQVFLLGPLLTVTQELLTSHESSEFHAIQLFTLWLQCAHRNLQCLRSLINNNAQRFLTGQSSIVSMVLQCVWRYWHSPIDGVPDLIRTMFGSLLEAYKSENQLLNSEEKELYVTLASELLSSPRHLKGRYTLLSTLISHLGATATLELHPALPRELLGCLDTHHLVFAANETYKTLLKVLKAEFAESRSGANKGGDLQLECWQVHFQGVVSAGLCSDIPLVRNNMANTWLPTTFKLFPATFKLLLESTGRDCLASPDAEVAARSLHCSIILLKQARACKLLAGQDWMEEHRVILAAATHHHSDAIRGDTITLVCHSPKTAEPVNESEVRLVKALVHNSLSSDDTSLRNQLRIGVKALVIRLRDSSLAWLKWLQPALAKGNSSDDSGTQDPSPLIQSYQAKLLSAMDMVDWLLEECFGSLFPGACYQRKRASLDLLQLVYENFTSGKEVAEASNAQSTSFSAAIKRLGSWNRQLGKVSLFSERNASLLVNCLLDSSNDIRSSAYDLLIGYFPWPLPSSPANPWSSPSEILCQGLKLICSPKFHECEAGAMLCKISFHRQVVESSKGLEEFVKQSKKKPAAAATDSAKGVSSQGSPPIQFVVSLLQSLKFQFKCARTNILRAAALTPMHGIILAMRKSLLEDARIFETVVARDREAWQAILREINGTLRHIIHFILGLLAGHAQAASPPSSIQSSPVRKGDGDPTSMQRDDGGDGPSEMDTGGPGPIAGVPGPDGAVGSPALGVHGLQGNSEGDSQHISPSFGKMGEEIEKLVMDLGERGGAGGEDSEESTAILSTEHQLILSCCWLTLKESSLLMGALAKIAPPFGDASHNLLDKQQFELMSDCLVQILTKCRHKGALEGCKSGFYKVCAAMLSCPDPEMVAIPRKLLDLVFAVIGGTSSSSSYTKKSAGLPPLVESIIVAEPRGRERHLLKYTVEKLMEIARLPLPEQPDAKQDLPQSHGLNILRSLFVNSSLAWDVLPYAEEAVQLAIDGFSSSNWAVQNSSMQLLGALIARIFGQKKVQDEHSQVNTLSAPEFFQRYPRLRAYLLQEVRTAASLHQDSGSTGSGKLHLIPRLHPVLLILTKLGGGMATPEQKRDLQEFIQPIQSLVSSPIYSVRDLASRAMLPLLSDAGSLSNMTLQLLSWMPPSEHPVIFDQNRLHGNLLMIQKMMNTCINNNSLEEDSVEAITAKLGHSLWIGTSTNPCAITRAQFMGICTLWWEGAFGVKPDDLSDLMVKAKTIVDEFFGQSPTYQVGLSSLGLRMTNAFLSMFKFIPSHITDIPSLTRILLTYGLPEVREVTLKQLRNTLAGSRLDPETASNLWQQVTDLLLVENDWDCLPVALDVWVEFSKCVETRPEGDWLALTNRLLSLLDAGNGGTGQCWAALPALGVALKLAVSDIDSSNETLMYNTCDLIVTASDPGQCETLRMAAAKALQHCALHVFQMCKPDKVEHCDFAFMLLQAGMQLLQDEQSSVREEAAKFASRIPRDDTVSPGGEGYQLHCSTGLKVLLRYTCNKFCSNMNFLDAVTNLLVGDAFSAQELIQEETSGNSLNLFEQESINIYAEGVMEADAVFQAVKHVLPGLVESKRDIFWKWNEERWVFVQQQLTTITGFLETHPVAANSFYAGTGHSKPYQALYRLLLYVRLLQEVSILTKPTSERVQKASQKIADHLKSLQEMFYVFPLLKAAIPTVIKEDAEEKPSEMD